MPALARLLVAATVVLALALAAGSASAEERMWIGFHDDPVLRYGPDRLAEMDAVRGANETKAKEAKAVGATVQPLQRPVVPPAAQ